MRVEGFPLTCASTTRAIVACVHTYHYLEAKKSRLFMRYGPVTDGQRSLSDRVPFYLDTRIQNPINDIFPSNLHFLLQFFYLQF